MTALAIFLGFVICGVCIGTGVKNGLDGISNILERKL